MFKHLEAICAIHMAIIIIIIIITTIIINSRMLSRGPLMQIHFRGT